MIANVCETLARARPGSGRPEAGLATTWATDDQRVWTFTLREGVRFQDGAALDADAVVANFDHLQREVSFPGHARRVGPLVVQLTMDRPRVGLPATLTQVRFSIQSPRQLAAGGPWPVCTGAFRIHSARRGEVELRRWDAYWGGAPRVQAVRFRRYADASALLRALLRGEADVSSALGPQQAALVREQPSLLLDSQTGDSLVYLAMNGERAPFADARVRRAVAQAIDRPALVRLLGGHAAVAHGPLPPSVLGHAPPGEPPFDPLAARQLLASAGVRPGTPLVISVSRVPRPYLTDPLRVAARLREDLAAVGFEARLRQLGWGEQVALTSRGDFQAALLGWHADTLEPDDFLSSLVDSRAVGSTNRSRYRSPAMDALLDQARGQRLAASRLALYRKAQQLFNRDLPFVPLFHPSVFTAHRRDLRGLVIGPTGILRYEKAWKQP